MSDVTLGIDKSNLPLHIAIIMDGNGRWAQKRGLPRKAGHKAGAKAFRNICESCKKMGIKYLTVYAFSTENWKRPKDEVDAIMKLFSDYLDKAFDSPEKGVRINFIGDKSKLDDKLKQKIAKIELNTKNETQITVNIAINYGGRDEIINVCKLVAQKASKGEISKDEITEEYIDSLLYTAGQPDPDLIIRPSGEQRLSNFLIWQAVYAEFIFMDVLWPDFCEKDLEEAIFLYQQRDRRFGGVQA